MSYHFIVWLCLCLTPLRLLGYKQKEFLRFIDGLSKLHRVSSQKGPMSSLVMEIIALSPFIISFNKYLLSMYDMPGTVLGIGDTIANKTGKIPCSWEG